jgi:hypothetical protein
MTTDTTKSTAASPLLEAILNLSAYHREHEKFYSSSPRETAVTLQRHARTLQALAEQWATATPSTRDTLSPYEGADDLNSPVALQLDGVLFMEGEGRPAEVTHLIRDLRSVSEDFLAIGAWLSTAMQASWDMATALLSIEGLADVLGERHRIIANDWQAADMSSLVGRLVARAADMLDQIDFRPEALRRDLAGRRVTAGQLYSVGELIGRAADLCSDSAGLVHDNERRWRTFRERVAAVAAAEAGVAGGPPDNAAGAR